MPTTSEMNAHSPTAMTGNTQPLRKMFAMNNAAAAIEMIISRFSAGNCALTSV